MMDSGLESIIKQELPDCPPTELDLNVLDSMELDLKPPSPQTQAQALEIGSKNSAFQPYKVNTNVPLTILTNLQRGNVKTLARDIPPTHPLSFQEKAAKGSLTEGEISESKVNALDPDGLSALHWASFHGKLNIVEMLLKRRADVNLSGPDGQTALMFAATKGHVDVVNFLVTYGADLEIEDEYGNTALIHSANANQSQVVAALLGHGASMTKPNFIGDNAFDVAFRKGHRASQFTMEMHLKKLLEANLA